MSNDRTSKQQRVEQIRERSKSPDHVRFQALLDTYMRTASFVDRADAPTRARLAEEIVEAREAIFEWARAPSETFAVNESASNGRDASQDTVADGPARLATEPNDTQEASELLHSLYHLTDPFIRVKVREFLQRTACVKASDE